jgi:tetratricopeptide (TPR) repeat protein
MPLETYKKWSIAVIVISIAAVIVTAAITSKQKEIRKETDQQEAVQPKGPMLGSEQTIDRSALPDDPKQLATLGDSYFEKQQFGQAAIVYEKTIELAPDDFDTYNDLGLAYLYTNRPEKAIENLRRGTEVNPSYQRVWLSLGFALMSLERHEEAKPALEKAIELGPDSTVGKEAMRMLGMIKK